MAIITYEYHGIKHIDAGGSLFAQAILPDGTFLNPQSVEEWYEGSEVVADNLVEERLKVLLQITQKMSNRKQYRNIQVIYDNK